jgi:hypothetical protein
MDGDRMRITWTYICENDKWMTDKLYPEERYLDNILQTISKYINN